MAIKQIVNIWESERGWGRRIDEQKEFDSIKEAKEFIDKFNTTAALEADPDWYMFAELGKVIDK